MIDLKEVVNNLSPQRVIELVTNLGSDQYIEKDDYIIFKTICHNVDASEAKMKLYYYKRNKKFHCYTHCGDNFNIIELFKRRYELLGVDYNFYKDIALVITGDNAPTKEEGFSEKYVSEFDDLKHNEAQVELTHLNPSLLNTFTFYPTPEWLNDGISEETMRRFGIRYSIDQNKIIIPHYDKDNFLIGIRGRALNEEDIEIGKYMPVQIEGKIYAHPLGYNLYGLNLVKENIKRFKMAVVAESEKSVLQYDTMFGHDKNICVAVCGSNLSAYQMNLLLELGVEYVLIAFDNEGETYQEKQKYYKKLFKMCERYKLRCNMGFIFDQDKRLNLKDSPTDKGKEVYMQLSKEAVWLK